MTGGLPYRAPDALGAAPKSNRFKSGGDPILIGANVTLSEGAVRAVPSDARFFDSFRRHLAIDEIRFVVRSPDVLSYIDPNLTDYNWGASIACQFRFGREDICPVAVPVCMFGPDILEDPRDDVVTGATNRYGYSHFHWRLPQPVLLRPQMGFFPTFTRRLDGFGGTAQVNIAVVGRILNDIPPNTETAIPHVGFFETPQIVGASGGTGFAQSTENDFNNPYSVPLYVQRFIARSENDARTSINGGLQLAPATGTLTMIDPDDRVIVNASQNVSTEDVFFYTQSRPIYRVMAPGVAKDGRPWRKKHYKVKIDRYATSATRKYRVMVSMIGWRFGVI